MSFYTLDEYPRHVARIMQKFGTTMLAGVAILPFFIVGISSLARTHPKVRMTRPLDKFGEGAMRAKIVIVLISSVWLTLGAAFRATITWLEPVRLLMKISFFNQRKVAAMAQTSICLTPPRMHKAIAIIWKSIQRDTRADMLFFCPRYQYFWPTTQQNLHPRRGTCPKHASTFSTSRSRSVSPCLG